MFIFLCYGFGSSANCSRYYNILNINMLCLQCTDFGYVYAVLFNIEINSLDKTSYILTVLNLNTIWVLKKFTSISMASKSGKVFW